uniref:ABC-2 type transporter transmembrane domain-containing protein n=1 Tax=Timema tahoe TaxID=61484 RepID=A0A7R9FFV8_9NEOP|nr:unnamed protein product [Timema tahoe]
MLYCVLHTSVSYLLTAQPLNIERFAMFMLSCLLITLIGESIGLLLGTLCNPVNGTFLGSIYICFMLLFSGFLILFNHMSNYMYWMSYLSAFRYTTMGMFLSLYDFGRDGLPCPEDITYCHLRSPRLILKEFGVTAGHYWVNIGALVFHLLHPEEMYQELLSNSGAYGRSPRHIQVFHLLHPEEMYQELLSNSGAYGRSPRHIQVFHLLHPKEIDQELLMKVVKQ